jgi:hypothetical protein
MCFKNCQIIAVTTKTLPMGLFFLAPALRNTLFLLSTAQQIPLLATEHIFIRLKTYHSVKEWTEHIFIRLNTEHTVKECTDYILIRLKAYHSAIGLHRTQLHQAKKHKVIKIVKKTRFRKDITENVDFRAAQNTFSKG